MCSNSDFCSQESNDLTLKCLKFMFGVRLKPQTPTILFSRKPCYGPPKSIEKIIFVSGCSPLNPYQDFTLDLHEAQVAPLNPAKLVTFSERKKSFNSFNNDNPGAKAYKLLMLAVYMTGLLKTISDILFFPEYFVLYNCFVTIHCLIFLLKYCCFLYYLSKNGLQ